MLIQKGSWGIPSIWECDICKKHFNITNSRASDAINKKQKKLCSKKCLKEYQCKISSRRVVNWIKNNPHPLFNGGFGITSDGYVWILIKDGKHHHNQVKLHRYLMEVKIGRTLKSTEIVHHINGDKFDNKIENLEIITSIGEHNRRHNNFGAENRDDCYQTDEIELIKSGASNKTVRKLYPNRTISAINAKRYRLKTRKERR